MVRRRSRLRQQQKFVDAETQVLTPRVVVVVVNC